MDEHDRELVFRTPSPDPRHLPPMSASRFKLALPESPSAPLSAWPSPEYVHFNLPPTVLLIYSSKYSILSLFSYHSVHLLYLFLYTSPLLTLVHKEAPVCITSALSHLHQRKHPDFATTPFSCISPFHSIPSFQTQA
jgi:hypothetical protein